MWYVIPNEDGLSYTNPCSVKGENAVGLPDNLLSDFIAAKGFVTFEITDGVATSLTVNEETLATYEKDHPEVEPEEPKTVMYYEDLVI